MLLSSIWLFFAFASEISGISSRLTALNTADGKSISGKAIPLIAPKPDSAVAVVIPPTTKRRGTAALSAVRKKVLKYLPEVIGILILSSFFVIFSLGGSAQAIPFISNMKPRGMYGRMALRLKDECYLRLVEMIKRGELSFADELASKVYEHQLLKESITIQNEFLEECAVVRFKDVQSGKKTLLTKKEMNQMLGKGRSMDLLDPCAMRMFPVLELPYGDELTATYQEDDDYMDDDISSNSIYDETLWC